MFQTDSQSAIDWQIVTETEIAKGLASDWAKSTEMMKSTVTASDSRLVIGSRSASGCLTATDSHFESGWVLRSGMVSGLRFETGSPIETATTTETGFGTETAIASAIERESQMQSQTAIAIDLVTASGSGYSKDSVSVTLTATETRIAKECAKG